MRCPICGERHTADDCPRAALLPPGTRLDDKYMVVRHLSTGGMGAVYEVEHTLIGKRLAAKVLLPDLARKRDILERFRREARAASAIGHEHIVDVTDLGQMPALSGGAPFIVMELLRGRTLGDELGRLKRIEPARAVRIARQMLSALAAAHQRGIVHRDLKPDNIFLVRREADEDFVKVLDFGISKFIDNPAEQELTRAGAVIGTPTYMAPEQANGSPSVDHRADLYATGAMLYRMLTGVRPYTAPNFQALVYQILEGKLVPPRERTPGIPAHVEAAVLRAMAVPVEQRFQSARQFADALATDEERTTERQAGRAPSPSEAEPPGWSQQSSTMQPSSGPARRQLLSLANLLLGAAVLLLATVALSYVVHRRAQRARLEEAMAADVPLPRPALQLPPPVITPSLVHLSLVVEPPEAALSLLTLDGAQVARAGIDVARDGQRHVLHGEAPGYAPADLPFFASNDQSLTLQLKKRSAAARKVRSLDKQEAEDPQMKMMMQLVNGLKGELAP